MKKLTVDGITFETTKEAKAAERELEAIEKIRGRMDVTNPIYAKVLYEKLIEKEMLHTKVGEKFLAELQSYFDPEAAAKDPAETSEEVSAGSARDEAAETSAEESAEISVKASAKALAGEEEEVTVPYLDETAREKSDRAAEEKKTGSVLLDGNNSQETGETAAKKFLSGTETVLGVQTPGNYDASDIQDEIIFETDFDDDSEIGSGKNGAQHGGVSSDTGRLESILHGAIFDEKDLIPFEENPDGSAEAGADAVSEEDLPDEYFGATGLDALVEEYDEKDADESKKSSAQQTQPEEEEGETPEDDEADLDAFMKEYGLTDIAEEGSENARAEQPEEEDDDIDEADPAALMEEYGVTETVKPKTGEAVEQPEEEDDEISAEELDTLVDEYAQTGAVEANTENAAEPPVSLNMEEKDGARQEDSAFHLDLDDADLYDEDPDDDTLLAEAVTLKKELHQEDLSEVFSERDEQPEKKRFSLYGVLIVSLILNVVLIASMVIMVQVFKDSDNRNILNYERILEQEYQTATPSDAE